MALAWPRLRHIFLRIRNQAHWRSKINLEGLLHLAQNCAVSRASAVYYEFDVSVPTNPMYSGERPGTGIRNESEISLCVGRSSITNPPAVTAWLCNVVPNLRLGHSWHLTGHWDTSDDKEDPEFIEMCKRWAEVDKLCHRKRSAKEIYVYRRTKGGACVPIYHSKNITFTQLRLLFTLSGSTTQSDSAHKDVFLKQRRSKYPSRYS